MREFATGAGVNVNTARGVYSRLEEQGLTVSRQGLGTFVSPYVPVAPTLEQFAAEVAAEAIAQGIDPRELARALYAGSSPGRAFGEELDQDDAEPALLRTSARRGPRCGARSPGSRRASPPTPRAARGGAARTVRARSPGSPISTSWRRRETT